MTRERLDTHTPYGYNGGMTQTFLVQGMSCDHCVRAVTVAITKLPGVNGSTSISQVDTSPWSRRPR